MAQICGQISDKRVRPRYAHYTAFYAPGDAPDHESGHESDHELDHETGVGALIDRGLVLWFPAPGSFTGEDTVEFQCHGSLAVEQALYGAFRAAGARMAEAGEFTRRALINGKIDLAQAEGLADLIDAETETQRKQALGQLDGRLSEVAETWRAQLITIAAALEADIDFPDEDDVPAAVAAGAGPAIDRLLDALRAIRAGAEAGQRIREGVRIAIIGAPNAGKSSLLNQLAGEDRAIVSDIPGTTRDVIDLRLDLAGIAVTVFDTAGLRERYTDEIEAEGARRSLKAAENADLRVFLVDVSRETRKVRLPGAVSPYTIDDVSRETGAPARAGDLLVLNKIDRLAEGSVLTLKENGDGLPLSVKTGEGLSHLIDALTIAARSLVGRSEERLLTRARHAAAIDRAIPLLESARGQIAGEAELAADDVRLAARALGTITGAVDIEDVLGEIFSSFCIGK